MSYIGNEPIVSATRTVTEITATAGQTVFTANGGYTVGYIDVFVNGSQLTASDFTATNGSTITLNEAATVNDIVRLVAWGTFQTSSALTANNPSYTGTLTGGTGVVNIGSGQLYKDASGNVGIGTSSPTVRLQTNGAVAIQGTAAFPSSGAGIELYYDTTNGSHMQSYDRTASAWKDLRLNSGLTVFSTSGAERMRITSGGNVGIGTNNPVYPLQVSAGSSGSIAFMVNPSGLTNFAVIPSNSGTTGTQIGTTGGDTLAFITNNSEKMRIESGGNVLVGTTVYNDAFKGILLSNNGRLYAIADGAPPLTLNRLTNDGDLVEFKQAGTIEGTISVSGTTVSYNGGHLSRWAQTIGAKDESLLKGTVLSNLDEMNEYVDAEGNPVDNEQLNKVKVSDVEGDVNVAGVFVNWSHDEAHNVDEINMAMTGDMIIRIAQGVVVQRGDLLMSAGDGTAKPQGDDIVRSKTVAKVTSNHVTCTYEDGSYCVPCVLMAC